MWIMTVVFAAAVVKKRKQPYNRNIRSSAGSQNTSVSLDSPPVIGAVDRVFVTMMRLGNDGSPKCIVIRLLHKK